MEKQSVRIGVDRFFIAKIIGESPSEITYEPSEHIPGVNYVAVTPNQQIGSFYADDGVYETYIINGEVHIQVSFAGISNETAAKLTGATCENGLLVDKKSDSPPYMAIGFRTQKSNGHYRYVWLYKGRFSKSPLANTTKSSGVSPQTDVYDYTAVCRTQDGAWRQMLDSDCPDLPEGFADTLNSDTVGWFTDPNITPLDVPDGPQE